MFKILSPQEIKDIRKSMGLTQLRFALELGVTPLTVTWWESGKHSPSVLALQKLLILQSKNVSI